MTEKSCGAVIYYRLDHEPYYLLIQHRNGNHWSFPKGHVEENESEMETAKREILEETQLEISRFNPSFRQMISYKVNGCTVKNVIYFLAQVEYEKTNTVTVQKAEIISFYWLPFEEAKELITYENDRLVLQIAHQSILTR